MKVMVLHVFCRVLGNYAPFPAPPNRTRLVMLEDELEFISRVRIRALTELHMGMIPKARFMNADEREALFTDILRSLQVNLYATGLTDFPETEDEMYAVIDRTMRREVDRRLGINPAHERSIREEVHLAHLSQLCPPLGTVGSNPGAVPERS
jgi:hypothetical protein